jgi:hypothetical protein
MDSQEKEMKVFYDVVLGFMDRNVHLVWNVKNRIHRKMVFLLCYLLSQRGHHNLPLLYRC